MWKNRTPRNTGDSLWRYVADLRQGDDHDPEEELRSLMPVARLVSDALQGGSEGPEQRSERRLMAAIAQSESKPQPITPRRAWALPALATAGWVSTTVCASLFAYQVGINQGTHDGHRLAEASRPVTPVASLPAKPPVTQIAQVPEEKPKAEEKAQPQPEQPAPPQVESPPSVRVDEIISTEELLALVPISDPNSPDPELDSMIREGGEMLAKGEWDKAASSFEQAAVTNPNAETSLDALHLSGAIAERALNDPKRANEMYRREMEMARRMLEQREATNEAPAEPVKQRLARAMTYVGLMEKNPQMILKAAQESKAPTTSSGHAPSQ